MLYKNNYKKFSCHFGDDDIIIDDFILNPVHILPQNKWQLNQEVDFYMNDNINIYLLRIINSNEYSITLSESSDIRYIIVRVKVDETYDTLRKVVMGLKEFPYSKKISGNQQSYSFLR